MAAELFTSRRPQFAFVGLAAAPSLRRTARRARCSSGVFFSRAVLEHGGNAARMPASASTPRRTAVTSTPVTETLLEKDSFSRTEQWYAVAFEADILDATQFACTLFDTDFVLFHESTGRSSPLLDRCSSVLIKCRRVWDNIPIMLWPVVLIFIAALSVIVRRLFTFRHVKNSKTFVRPRQWQRFDGRSEPLAGMDQMLSGAFTDFSLRFNCLLSPDKLRDALAVTLDSFPAFSGRMRSTRIDNFAAGACSRSLCARKLTHEHILPRTTGSASVPSSLPTS